MIVSSNRMNFTEAVQDILNGLHLEAVEQLTIEIPKVAKEAAKKLQHTSPVGPTGEYAKSWTSMAEKSRLQVGATVYAEAPGYRLAHLLEYGHANRGGGRTSGREHIKPVEEWAIKEAEDRIVEALERKMR